MSDEEMTPGYCDLCRTKETEKYNKILKIEDYENEDDYYEAHMICCYEADCKHPALYIINHQQKSMSAVFATDVVSEEINTDS